MTDRTLLKQAYIATLCNHKDAHFYRNKAFSEQNLDQLAKQIKDAGEKITKADFFSCDHYDQYFLDNSEAWKNFDKIVDIVHDNGERFEISDFLQNMGPANKQRTFLDSALEYGAFEKVFQAKIWEGRYEEMEKLYYSILPRQRRQYDGGAHILSVKREIFEAANKKIREDILQDSGIDWQDLPKLFTYAGGIERLTTVSNTLRSKGERLTKEDLFMPDFEGDTMFRHDRTWAAFPQIVSLLENAGQQFDVEDFLFKRGHKLSVIQRAAEHNALAHVFNEQVWKGRPADMVRLWNAMDPAPKSTGLGHDKFLKVLNAVESDTYGSLFKVDQRTSLADIKSPVAIEGDVKIMPMGLKAFWDNFDRVQDNLSSKKQGITVKDLRETTGFQKTPVLELAIKNGHLDKVVKIAETAKDSLTLQDFLNKDDNGLTLLQIISRQEQLDQLFKPSLWAGRIKDMTTLWAMVDFEDKTQVNWQEVLNETNLLTLQKGGKGASSPKIRRRK
jgi:hypothetical protein